MKKTLTCWAMTTGEIGMTNQALGLAQQLSDNVELKEVTLNKPWTLLPGHWVPKCALDLPKGPYPDLLITCGRRSVPFSIAIRKLSKGKTKTVHIQNPLVPPKEFDLVIPMRHDRLSGPNVHAVPTALHKVTPEFLKSEGKHFEKEFSKLPRPLIACILGGNTKDFTFSKERAQELCAQLTHLLEKGHGLLLTFSRRTPEAVKKIFLSAFSNNPAVYIWDEKSKNPYMGMLALADFILVTEESVSMISESCLPGKPVYLLKLEGFNKRLAMFQKSLIEKGLVRFFEKGLEKNSQAPVNSTADAANLVKKLIL